MRCVALLSGGLDSWLAIKIMQAQGIEVDALNFKTVFTCCQATAAQTAHELKVPLTILSADEDYLQLIRKPMFGYGKGANPCVDCRIYMFQRARSYMEQVGAQFMVSGEVLGQRPKSQKRRDLEVIAHHSELADLLLRPLSAKLLEPTLPERNGWVNRNELFAFTGQSRKGLIELAKRFGIKEIPTPSNGCALTETAFSHKVFDLFENHPKATRDDFELLQVGRHFRLDPHAKLILGKNEVENQTLQRVFYERTDTQRALLTPCHFHGPTGLLLGSITNHSLNIAGGLLARFAKQLPENAEVESRFPSESPRIMRACVTEEIIAWPSLTQPL